MSDKDSDQESKSSKKRIADILKNFDSSDLASVPDLASIPGLVFNLEPSEYKVSSVRFEHLTLPAVL